MFCRKGIPSRVMQCEDPKMGMGWVCLKSRKGRLEGQGGMNKTEEGEENGSGTRVMAFIVNVRASHQDLGSGVIRLVLKSAFCCCDKVCVCVWGTVGDEDTSKVTVSVRLGTLVSETWL